MSRIAVFGLFMLLTACGGGGKGFGDPFPADVTTDAAIVDIDGDGRRDVLTLEEYVTSESQREGRLYVRRQRSDGTFRSAELYVVSTYPWRMFCVDLDGDGVLDVLITDAEADKAFWLRQDKGNPGHLLAATELARGGNGGDIVAADFNGDGAKDVALSASSGRIMILYQDPARPGSFRAPVDVALPDDFSSALTIGDLDGDGREDLAVWHSTNASGAQVQDGALAYALQQAGGGFTAFTTVATRRGVNCRRLAIGDYSGAGGIALLAYLTPESGDYTAEIVVSPRDPSTGRFSSVTGAVLSGVRGTDDAAFADLDADGRMDAAVVGGSIDPEEARLNRLRQRGDGSLQPAERESLSFFASVVTLGDLNGDGRDDIVVYGGNNETLVLLQSQTAPGQFDTPRPL